MSNLFKKNRNFRNYLLYQTFAGLGHGMFAMFMMWAVHARYQNTLYTGIAGFMFAAPRVASFIIGPFVDRSSKVAIMRVTRFVQLVIVGLLLVQPFMFGVWFTFLAILVFTIANTICTPAETAFLPGIVGSDDLVKANAFIRILATVGGLAIGGFLYFSLDGRGDFTIVFAVNAAVLFLAFAFALLIRRDEKSLPEYDGGNYFAELKNGFSYIRSGVMAHLVIVFILTSIVANAAYVNLPMLAEIHTGSASGYILLAAVSMVGGVLGVYIARAVSVKLELFKIFVIGFIAMGAARIIFVHVIADDFRRALLILALYAGIVGAIGLLVHSLQQKILPKKILGRFFTIETTLLGLAAAIGSLVGGAAGRALPDVDTVFVIQGAAYILIGLGLCFSRHVRALGKIGDEK